jgi:hypothetical protein
LVQYTPRDDTWRSKVLGEQMVDPRLVFRNYAANIHKHAVKSRPIQSFVLPVAVAQPLGRE